MLYGGPARPQKSKHPLQTDVHTGGFHACEAHSPVEGIERSNKNPKHHEERSKGLLTAQRELQGRGLSGLSERELNFSRSSRQHTAFGTKNFAAAPENMRSHKTLPACIVWASIAEAPALLPNNNSDARSWKTLEF